MAMVVQLAFLLPTTILLILATTSLMTTSTTKKATVSSTPPPNTELCPISQMTSEGHRKHLPCEFVRHNRMNTLFLGKSMELKNLDRTRLLHNRPTLCQHDTDLLILIISWVSAKECRDAMRKTWLNTPLFDESTKRKGPKIRYSFLTGMGKDQHNLEVAAEIKLHNDIIVFDSYDRDHFDLTSKTAAALNWAGKYCPNAKYVMKTNCQLMVNPFLLKNFDKLMGMQREGVLTGIAGTKPPAEAGIFSVPDKLWPWALYPEYLTGGTYTFDQQALISINNVVKQIPYFPFDEVFFTGIAAPLANVRLELNNRFLETSFKKDFWKKNSTLAYISSSSKTMVDEWNTFLRLTAGDFQMETLLKAL